MLTSQAIKTNADPRMLGIVLTKIVATPTIMHTGLPYVVIMGRVMAVLCATLAWLLGVLWLRIIVVSMTMLMVVTEISGTYVVEPLLHWHWFAAWLAICSLGIVIAWQTWHPIIVLAFFVIKRRWWALIGFVAGMVLWNGLAILVSDWHTSAQFLTTVLPSIGGTTSWIDNQTITGFLARFYDTPY